MFPYSLPLCDSFLVFLCLSWPWLFWRIVMCLTECPSICVWCFIIDRLRLWIWGMGITEIMCPSHHIISEDRWYQHNLLLVKLTMVILLWWCLPSSCCKVNIFSLSILFIRNKPKSLYWRREGLSSTFWIEKYQRVLGYMLKLPTTRELLWDYAKILYLLKVYPVISAFISGVGKIVPLPDFLAWL